jgi:hypothetical protein
LRAIHGYKAIAYERGRDVGTIRIPESGREDLHAAESRVARAKPSPFSNTLGEWSGGPRMPWVMLARHTATKSTIGTMEPRPCAWLP